MAHGHPHTPTHLKLWRRSSGKFGRTPTSAEQEAGSGSDTQTRGSLSPEIIRSLSSAVNNYIRHMQEAFSDATKKHSSAAARPINPLVSVLVTVFLSTAMILLIFLHMLPRQGPGNTLRGIFGAPCDSSVTNAAAIGIFNPFGSACQPAVQSVPDTLKMTRTKKTQRRQSLKKPASPRRQSLRRMAEAPWSPTEPFVDDPEEAARRPPADASCDLWSGRWVYDESYPLWRPGSCPLVEKNFQCWRMGRQNLDFMKFRWQPYGCNLPR